MRSKTSFFNATLFWKNIRRFWPLWAAYLAGWFLLLPLSLLSGGYGTSVLALRYSIYHMGIIGGVFIGAVMGVFSAMAMWGFLYNPRSAHGIACLPLRREGIFLTNLLSGFAPVVAANAVNAVLTALVLFGKGNPAPGAALEWFAMVTLIGFFFYGFATLCAQLTGHILVLPAVYGILNFVAVAVEYLLKGILGSFVYGMHQGWSGDLSFRWLSPPVKLGMDLSAVYLYPEPEVPDGTPVEAVGVEFHGWGIMLAYVVVGVAMSIGALLLFRRRRMETAGDVVAVQPLKPVFRWCMALGVGMVLSVLMYQILFSGYSRYYWKEAFLVLLAFWLAGALIGWYAAEMLIKKTFRVFNRKNWAGLGICAAVIVAFMLSARLDLFGYERRVPAADQVDTVILASSGVNAVVSRPESIELVRQVHQKIIEDRDWNRESAERWTQGNFVSQCMISYLLKNGSTVNRYYDLNYETDGNGVLLDDSRGELADLNLALNSQEAILNRKETAFPLTRDNVYYGSVTTMLSAPECAAAAGYDSPEEYLLLELLRWTENQFRSATPEEKLTALAQCVLDTAVNGNALLAEAAGGDVSDYGKWYYDSRVEVLAQHLDLSRAYFNFTWPLNLSPEEWWELYQDCLMPDLREGTLGRVWAVKDREYVNSVYQVRVSIDAREPRDGRTGQVRRSAAVYDMAVPATPGASRSGNYDYAGFYTVPTVNSFRTNAWLRTHGVICHTEAETGAGSNFY